MRIFSHGNYIHFNERFNKQSVLKLTEEIEKTNKFIAKIKEQLHISSQVPILLFINSWGGCVDSALGISNIVEFNVNPIITVITGQSASAGTMLSIVGHRRLIYPNSYAMVHEGSSYIGGNNEDIEVDMYNMNLTEKNIKDTYLKNTILTSMEYDKLCLDDRMWDADTCYVYGLVDKVITDASKLQDWNWLMSITSRKKNQIVGIKRVRQQSQLFAKKRKILTMKNITSQETNGSE